MLKLLFMLLFPIPRYCSALACLDIFPNIDRVKMVSCPVMIIHGVLDQEVNHAHGVALYNNIPKEFRREPCKFNLFTNYLAVLYV